MEDLRRAFQNPPASHRPAPLWVWNDDMTEEQISYQLEQFASHGFGGAFVHPRPGLYTEYLSEKWFRQWGFALKKAKELNLKLYIYDENSYPSGFAGGHVSALLPDCLAMGMTYDVIDLRRAETDENGRVKESNLPTLDPISVFACRADGDEIEILKDISEFASYEWAGVADQVFVVSPVKADTTGWLAGFAYVDLLRPEVHEAFMQTTYEEYYKRFGEDFGGAIPAIFTDEPYIGAGSVYSGSKKSLPFSYWLMQEFERINGYSLVHNLPGVFKNVTGALDYPAEKIRFDYYRTIQTLWTQNSISASGKWCAEHNIAFTGHYLEHQWPCVGSNTSPSMQSNYEFHQWPAIDMLLSSYLRDTETHALSLTIQEIRSAANQFGKERTLCELYGAGGWDSNFEDYKRMGDWVLVNGINFINQHLTYSTLAGARKRDHPQSFDWREPWWDQYTRMNDYLGRAGWMLSQGRMEQRILLLNPSTTGYLVPAEEESANLFSEAGTDAVKNPDMHAFLELVRELDRGQWDYDYGDEFTIARHASVEGAAFRLVKQRYDVVIISGDMKNLLASTVQTLKDFMAAGGKVLAVGQPGPYVDGLVDESAFADLAKNWESVSPEKISARLEALTPNRIKASVPFPHGFAHMRRKLDDGREIWFFVNHAFQPYEAEIELAGESAAAYNLFTGEAQALDARCADGRIAFDLKLVRNQSAMIVVGETVSAEATAATAPTKRVALGAPEIRREQDNLLPIGYCDLRYSGREIKDVSVLHGGDVLFTARGFQKNPWDNKVQYFRNILDREDRYGEGSGFEADYRFYVQPGFAPEKLDVTVEWPEYVTVRVNGAPAPFTPGAHHLDHHFGVADIAQFVKDGENVITVSAERFNPRLELESIYLRGAFSVAEVQGRWTLAPEQNLTMGAWRAQGQPFYPHAVRYTYHANLENAPQAARLNAPNVDCTAISAFVNGTEVLLNADGRRPADVTGLLKAGDNEIVVRVCGSMKNLLGPHFLPTPARGTAWPGMWKQAPTHQPAPEAYDLMDFGLNGDIELTIEA